MQQDKSLKEKAPKSFYCKIMKQKFSNYSTFAERIKTNRYKRAFEEFQNSTVLLDDESQFEDVPSEAKFTKKDKPATTLSCAAICLFSNVMYSSCEQYPPLIQKYQRNGRELWIHNS